MANELILSSPSGSTCYVVIRRHSDWTVWQPATSTWVAYVAGDLGDYDIPLTDQTGDVYNGDMPTDILTGTRVRISYYIQIGASPDDDVDTLVKADDCTWVEGVLGVSSSITLSTYALTTVESAKRYMRVTTNADDDLITELVNSISAKIEKICGYNFKARDYREFIDLNGAKSIIVNQYPLISVYRVANGLEKTAITITSTGFARATVNVQPDRLQLYSVATNGTVTKTNLLFATYDSSGEMATAISNVSGWSATKNVDCLCADLVQCSLGCKASSAQVQWYNSDINVETKSNGILKVLSTGDFSFTQKSLNLSKVLVEYRAGYETIPSDVSEICNYFVAQYFNLGKINTAMKSESLGDYAYTIADQISLNDEQTQKLQKYTKVRIGG